MEIKFNQDKTKFIGFILGQAMHRYIPEQNIGRFPCGKTPENCLLGTTPNTASYRNIPVGNIKLKLEYLCDYYGIVFTKQEESYTSKASFFDNDVIPKYNDDNPKDYDFSGKRVKRGLYKTLAGYCLNADVNGALNILKKSNVVGLTALYSRGAVYTPVRIRIV